MHADLAPVRRYRGASRDERRSQRREQLLRAAIQVYGEVGFRNATVRAVCASAGLTERYFYESFDNSEALLIAAYETVTASLIGCIAAAQDAVEGPASERVRAGLTHYLAALKGDPTLARLFLLEMPGVSEATDRAHNAALGTFAQMLARLFGDGTRSGEHDLLARGVVGAIFAIALHWIGCDYAQPIEAVVGAALRICLVLQPQD